MKKIKIDFSKCTGCHTCETACSLQHIENVVNPKRSRIRILRVGEANLPVIAGPYTEAECTSKGIVVFGGQEHDVCVLCRASCPAKPIFKEPDVDIPLKCDFCGEPPNPQCVRWCTTEALTLVDVEDEKKN
jgi:benzoyl-CoA reductase subunit BamC